MINGNTEGAGVDFTETPVAELYGSNCFSNTVMKEMLPQHIYNEVVAIQKAPEPK